MDYRGLDISEEMIEVAREQHPDVSFEVQDIIADPLKEESVDYIVMNGVLTEKQNMSQEVMVEFAQSIIRAAFKASSKGVAFNVMSSHVDWTRDDLFHWPLDEMVAFLVKDCSRHVRIHMDYGLYEYSVHVKKEPGI